MDSAGRGSLFCLGNQEVVGATVRAPRQSVTQRLDFWWDGTSNSVFISSFPDGSESGLFGPER